MGAAIATAVVIAAACLAFGCGVERFLEEFVG